MMEKPIPQSYWVLPGRFLAGEYPAHYNDRAGTRQRIAAFLGAGLDTYIDLTNPDERAPYASILGIEAKKFGLEVRHLRFPFPDFGVPSQTLMGAALEAVDAALAGGHMVYVHCVGGIGRTGLLVGCYFVRHGMQSADALRHLRQLYQASLQSLIVPLSPETDEQVGFILSWGENGLA
jgi:hypothetical protein